MMSRTFSFPSRAIGNILSHILWTILKIMKPSLGGKTVGYLQACKPQVGWNHKVDDADSWLLHQQPIRMPINWTYTLQPSPSPCLLKSFPESHWGIWAFWALAAWTLCFVPYNKHCTSLHHSPVSVDWFYCACEWIQIWFGNSIK